MPKKNTLVKGKSQEKTQAQAVEEKAEVSKKPSGEWPVKAPRGMHDALPSEQKYWEYVTETAKIVLQGWDWQKIDTPILEETKLFVRSLGAETDIVSKELFELKTRGGGAQYSLRPEGTAPVARSYIEHGMRSWPKPVKLFYCGPFFRYDRPQAGRLRQLHQFGMEVFGSVSPITEVEIMYVANLLLQQLGLEDYVFEVNSLGSQEDRKEYLKVLKQHLRQNKRKLSRESRERINTNPLRVLDSKDEKDQQVANTAPKLIDSLSDVSRQYFDKILKMLDEMEVPYEVKPGMVRGLDYYQGTVWEVVPRIVGGEDNLGQQASIAAGGRYDGLVKQLGGKSTPAVGMAFGIERIIDRIKAEGIELTMTDGPQVFVAQLSEQAKLTALRVMRILQEADIRFAESVDRDGMQPQLKLADRLGVNWVIVIGQKEVLDKTVILRNMESGMQEVVDQDRLVDELRKRIATM